MSSKIEEIRKINQYAKRPIDIWTEISYWFSIRLVYLIRQSSITPNGLTVLAFVFSVLSAVCFLKSTRTWFIFGAFLFQISYIFDCADGQLARYRKQFSPFGGWLDQVLDRSREFIIYLSLSWGYYLRTKDYWVWPIAIFALYATYMLEYYAQQNCQHPGMTKVTDVNKSGLGEGKAQNSMIRDLIKKQHNFNIGEQTLLLIILSFWGNAKTILISFAVIGFLFVVLIPIARTIKYYKNI
jgi:phosphatidylglycerophosphate synthase